MTSAAELNRKIYAERKASFWERSPYDAAFRGTFGAYMTQIESEALDRVFAQGQTSLLLDLGCGHGRFLRWLEGRSARMIGLDLSNRLLTAARKELDAEPLSVRCDLVRSSADALPFRTSSLETITCVRVIQHLPDPEAALREAHRALMRGGTLVLVQYNWLSLHGIIRALKIPAKALLRTVVRLLALESLVDEPTHWTTWRELRSQLARTGFTIERMTGAWLFPLETFRSRSSNNAWGPALSFALWLERLADAEPFCQLGGYLVVRCRKSS
jgi:ubiquinone/menaquinone biosynthesis C-methylase UbiE